MKTFLIKAHTKAEQHYCNCEFCEVTQLEKVDLTDYFFGDTEEEVMVDFYSAQELSLTPNDITIESVEEVAGDDIVWLHRSHKLYTAGELITDGFLCIDKKYAKYDPETKLEDKTEALQNLLQEVEENVICQVEKIGEKNKTVKLGNKDRVTYIALHYYTQLSNNGITFWTSGIENPLLLKDKEENIVGLLMPLRLPEHLHY